MYLGTLASTAQHQQTPWPASLLPAADATSRRSQRVRRYSLHVSKANISQGIETLSSKPVSKALPRPSQKIEALLQVSACAPVNHTIISANMTTPHDREKISALESKIKQLNMAHNVEMTEALNAVDYDVEKMAAAVEANEKLAEELKKVEQYERDLIVENIHLKRQVNRLQAKMKSVVETNKMAVEELKKIRNSMKWMNEQAKAMMEDKE
ncbi:uncharacterized protein J3D65DRAFT_607944 [Phyllosticta citribraziliensis]|uniref:Uncharacterized protein n=1 Tax=Phyllosticta citribraziliensis TaxID=989973 RepID=A0ABR1L4A6_9PEZI